MYTTLSTTINPIKTNEEIDTISCDDLVLLTPKNNRNKRLINTKTKKKTKTKTAGKKEQPVGIILEPPSYFQRKSQDNYKTVLCRSLYSNRKCHERCNFAHSISELRKRKCRHKTCYKKDVCKFWHEDDNLENWCDRNGYNDIKDLESTVSKTISIKKPQTRRNTKLCNTVTNGETNCRVECTYAHSLDELVILNCAFGKHCDKKDICKFKHEGETRSEYFKRNNLHRYKDITVNNTLTKCKIVVRVKPTAPLTSQKASGLKETDDITGILTEQEAAKVLLSISK